jgi:uncharacterized protein
VDANIAYATAAYHDLGLRDGRERHHLVSGEIVQQDERLRQWFTEEEILLIKEAVEDHRASSSHAPRSIYGRIVAEADRAIEPDSTFRRAIQYGLSHHPELDKEAQYERFHQHMLEKYAEGGLSETLDSGVAQRGPSGGTSSHHSGRGIASRNV